MKYIILLIAYELIFAGNICAQISLDSTSYPASVIGTDSLKITTSSSSFPSLAAMAGGMWDLSTVSDTTPVFYNYRVSAAPYQFADSSEYDFAGFKYQGLVLSSIRSGGLLDYGKFVYAARYNISALTSGPFDSLIIPSQTAPFSSNRIKIAFPTNSGSKWISDYQSNLTFSFSYLAFGDTLAPGLVRSYISETDTVTGWGKMSVKDAGGAASPFLNVLQVQTRIIKTDSFFLKGVPFSSTMLTFFGVTQGRKDTVYQQNYYRPMEVTPLAQVSFRDAAYSQPYKAVTHVQRLKNVEVEMVGNNDMISVYPNPVIGHKLTVVLPDGYGSCSFNLIDVAGHIVLNGCLSNTDQSSILLPKQLSSGIYYLQLSNDGNEVIKILPVEIE